MSKDDDSDSSSGASSPDRSDSNDPEHSAGAMFSNSASARRRGSDLSTSHAGSTEQSGLDREEDELSIPRAALNKMIKELAPNVRVANDARDLILNCCTEFIHLLSSEANELCNQQQKKTITPEHILTALDRLGFNTYRNDAGAVMHEAKAVAAKKRRASSKLENLGIPEEELLRQQQELFAKARMEQAHLEQQEWLQMQEHLQQQQQQQQSQTNQPHSINDDYD